MTWQSGHPDDWSDAEWRDWYNRALRQQARREVAIATVVGFILFGIAAWWGVV